MFSQAVEIGDDECAPSPVSLEPKDEIIAEVGDNIAEVTLPQKRRHEASTANNSSRSMGKRRNIRKTERVALSYMHELREAAIAAKPPPAFTIRETVELISKIEEIHADPDLYYFALNFMKDKSNREVFLSIPPDTRVWWIRTSYGDRSQ